MILQAACIPSKGFFLLAGAAPGAFQTGLMDLDPFRSDPIQIHSVSQSSAPVAGGINFLWENLYPQHPPGPYPYYEDPRYFPAGTVRIRDLYNSCHAFYQSLKLNVSIGFSTFFCFFREVFLWPSGLDMQRRTAGNSCLSSQRSGTDCWQDPAHIDNALTFLSDSSRISTQPPKPFYHNMCHT